MEDNIKDISSIIEQSKSNDYKMEQEINRGKTRIATIKLFFIFIIFVVAYFIGRYMINNNNNSDGEAVIALFIGIGLICVVAFTGNKD